MTIQSQIEVRRRALLIQALERHWPGCGAHTKRDEVVVSEMLPVQARREIGLYIAGWQAGTDAVLRIMQDETPFPDTDHPSVSRRAAKGREHRPSDTGRAAPSRQHDHSSAALAGLQALFSGQSEIGGSDAT